MIDFWVQKIRFNQLSTGALIDTFTERFIEKQSKSLSAQEKSHTDKYKHKFIVNSTYSWNFDSKV